VISAYALFRRSRSHQDLSIEEQREAVREWATAHGYSVIREFSDDGSGLDTERRRDFLALLNLCGDRRRREADTVLCYDVSRFSRLEPDEAAFHEYSLRRAGVTVVYTHEAGANETGVAGQLIKSLKRVMAEMRRQIGRLVDALAAGSEPMPSVRAAVVDLEHERDRLERELISAQARDVTTSPAAIDMAVNDLMVALANVRGRRARGAEGGGAGVSTRG
jgi:predicted site-specific integrase-resolvase